jgi:hypothetical protein
MLNNSCLEDKELKIRKGLEKGRADGIESEELRF